MIKQMEKRVGLMLTSVAEYLVVLAERLNPPEPPDNVLALRVKVLVEEASKHTNWSGEAKRHQVFSKLIKEFPDQRKRDLGYLIELAIQAMG